MLKVKIGVDVGGTFTDVVAIGEGGTVFFEKLPSTPQDQSVGVVNGILKMLKILGITPDCVTGVAHGTTVATNTLLERKGAVTALITTEGFRDVLQIGRQSRNQLYDLHAKKTEPLIPRYLRREAKERILYTGEIETELDEASLRQTVSELLDQGVESIAICFLHSYQNSENEKRALRVLEEIAPALPVSVSSDILPEFREFERMNTTVMNAYVRPGMQNYISSLKKNLIGSGIGAPLTIMQSSGGMMTDVVASQRSVNTLLSGPAGGVLAAEFLAGITDYKNIITGDLGGTSFDVSVITDGHAGITSEGEIEGFPVKFPHIDITTIGAGGGSIAWIDAGGALRVGPESAGAVPGPVCYKKGGTRPTVTDAHAVLGRVGTELLGGEMPLDIESARAAMKRELAEPLGMSIEEVAEGILKVADANMVRAIRVMTVEKGIDPRKYVLLPYGGAGAMHAVQLARALEIETLVVPIAPGNFSAFGLLAAPIRYDQVCTCHMHQNAVDLERMNSLLDGLDVQARAEMERDGVTEDEVRFEKKADMRYFGQAYELSIPIGDGRIDQEKWDEMVARFHQAHEKMYGFKNEGNPIENVNLRLSVVGKAENAGLYAKIEPADCGVEPFAVRPVYYMGKWMDTSIYSRGDLAWGHQIEGPAVIEEKGATVVMWPGDRAVVDERGNLVIHIAGNDKLRAVIDAYGSGCSKTVHGGMAQGVKGGN